MNINLTMNLCRGNNNIIIKKRYRIMFSKKKYIEDLRGEKDFLFIF